MGVLPRRPLGHAVMARLPPPANHDRWVTTDVHRIPMSGPGDTSGIAELIDTGILNPCDVVAVISQTEGTGHARAYAALALGRLLGRYLECEPEDVAASMPLMMIGMCGGLMSPHHNVVVRRAVQPPAAPPSTARLAVGVAATAPLTPTALGRVEQVTSVADAVRAAIGDAGLTAADVRLVEIKCPAFGTRQADAASAEGVAPAGRTSAETSSRSKAASALGVAVALGEVDAAEIDDEAITGRPDLWTGRGSVSAGDEQIAVRVLVMGNGDHSVSDLRIGAGVMTDQLDVSGVSDALREAGLNGPLPLDDARGPRLRQVFVNCGADVTSAVRGRRHTMHSDFLAGYAGIVSKAVANAIVAAMVGDPMILASAGAEHQGPPGANLVAALVEVR